MQRLLRGLVSFIYSLAAALIGICVLPIFALHPRGRLRLGERLGLRPVPPGRYIWFHGASMGEVNGLIPVLRLARERYPHDRILVTATSPTGLEPVHELADETRLLPFDSPWFIASMIGTADIRALVITETELWPGFLMEARSREFRSFLVNAIVTDYSYRYYRAFRPFTRWTLNSFHRILCGSERSCGRFIVLGAKESSVLLTGNSKYDRAPSVSSRQDAENLRHQLFLNERRTLVLGSLRPGEEDVWFPAVAQALSADGQFSVVIAPRHREKFEYFAEKLKAYALPFERRSQLSSPSSAPVLLLDTFGELEGVYSFCDMAFVGGSIVDWGGHNPLEPAAYGACLLMGPYARNVRDVVEDLIAHDALLTIRDTDGARHALELLACGDPHVASRGRAAQQVWQLHTGAALKIMDRISELLR